MSLMKLRRFPPIVILLLAVLLVAGGYSWGRWSQSGDQTSVPVSGSISPSEASIPPNLNFSLFWQAWNIVQAKFLRSFETASLTEGAIRGMVAALDDPYTVYLDPEAAQELSDGLQGYFSGIGAEVGVKNRRLVIVAPLPDSPAAQAGLKSLDEVTQIDGASVSELSFVDAIRKIRGADGTKVTLTIVREGREEPFDVPVTRGKIVIKSVVATVRPDGLGYLKITSFHEDTSRLATQALESFIDAKVGGVILDLRSNPGGLLSEGIAVTSLFFADGVVVKQKGKDGSMKSFSTSQPAVMPSIPLVVLVDGGSASASEIVAGALQDTHRAKLIGDQTFGKGSVQELEKLTNGGQLKVTIAEWLTPNDRQINGIGIIPDIVVEAANGDSDQQLARAIQELKPNE